MADPTNADTLPLLEALLLWCDPQLVEAVREAERRLTRYDAAYVESWPLLSKPDELRQREPLGWQGPPPDLAPLARCWRALERDFKQRLLREGALLRGVPVAPMRLAEHVRIPSVWAADFEFELLFDAIQISGARYVAVTVSRALARRTIGPSPESHLLSPGGDAAEPGDEELLARSRRGRVTYDPIIRKAMLDNWPDVRVWAHPPGGSRPNWSEIARFLLGRLAKQARRNREIVVPQLNTFRTRAPKIYAALLTENPDRN